MDLETQSPYINKKEVIDKISKLNNKEKQHILKLFISNDIQYTKNMNGYFFNLSTPHINDKFLKKVANSIDLIEKNRNVLNELDKNRDFMLQQCKELIEYKLNYSIKLKQNEYNKKITLLTIPNNINMKIKKNYHFIYQLKLKYVEELENEKLIYDKNSVFFRLNNNMKRLSRNKKIKHEIIENFNYPLEDIVGGENDNEFIQDIEEEHLSDIIDEEFIFDEKNEIDENDNENDLTNINDDNSDIDDSKSDNSDYNERIFYKQLLDQHGFNFNYDNNCKLVYNNYIE